MNPATFERALGNRFPPDARRKLRENDIPAARKRFEVDGGQAIARGRRDLAQKQAAHLARIHEILAGKLHLIPTRSDGQRGEIVGKNHGGKMLSEDVSRGFSKGQRSIFLK